MEIFQQFKKINVKFLCLEIEDRPDCQELQDALENLTGARSVPRVFIDGKFSSRTQTNLKLQWNRLKSLSDLTGNFVGGGTDIKKLYETGQLQKMLA